MSAGMKGAERKRCRSGMTGEHGVLAWRVTDNHAGGTLFRSRRDVALGLEAIARGAERLERARDLAGPCAAETTPPGPPMMSTPFASSAMRRRLIRLASRAPLSP